MKRLLPTVLAVTVLFGSAPAGARTRFSSDIPVSHLAGGGPSRTDCLAGLEVTGVDLGSRARTVVCEDPCRGDAASCGG
jgi:hypothetical protein